MCIGSLILSIADLLFVQFRFEVILVILTPLILVRKDFESGIDFFDHNLGMRGIVPVRMVLSCQTSVCLPQLRICGVLRYT